MTDPTSSDVYQSLFSLPSASRSFKKRKPEVEELESKVEILAALVRDLFLEVEALRQTQVSGSDYREAYLGTSLEAHNNAGPTDGWHKLVSKFYPPGKCADGRTWREKLFLCRLGFSKSEIEKFESKAQEMELYT